MKFLKAKEIAQEVAGPESLEGVTPLRVALRVHGSGLGPSEAVVFPTTPGTGQGVTEVGQELT